MSSKKIEEGANPSNPRGSSSTPVQAESTIAGPSGGKGKGVATESKEGPDYNSKTFREHRSPRAMVESSEAETSRARSSTRSKGKKKADYYFDFTGGYDARDTPETTSRATGYAPILDDAKPVVAPKPKIPASAMEDEDEYQFSEVFPFEVDRDRYEQEIRQNQHRPKQLLQTTLGDDMKKFRGTDVIQFFRQMERIFTLCGMNDCTKMAMTYAYCREHIQNYIGNVMRPTSYADLKKKMISHYGYADKDANRTTDERIRIFFNSLEIEDGYDSVNDALIKAEGLLALPGASDVTLREAAYLFHHKLPEDVAWHWSNRFNLNDRTLLRMTFARYRALVTDMLSDLTRHKGASKIKSSHTKSKPLSDDESTGSPGLVNEFTGPRIATITKLMSELAVNQKRMENRFEEAVGYRAKTFESNSQDSESCSSDEEDEVSV